MTEEVEVNMNSGDERSHVGSTAADPQDSDKEDNHSDVDKEAEECENSNGGSKGETSTTSEFTMGELHPDVSFGDFGRVVRLKSQRFH